MRVANNPQIFSMILNLEKELLTNADASTTRKPIVPFTRSCESRAPSDPSPIATVPTGWSTVFELLRMYSSSASSVVAFANSPNSLMM